jgi:IclR family acetate operon transcriptional repressor
MYSRVGGTNPALTTAIGRAILAHSPTAVVAEVIDGSRRLFDDGIRGEDVHAVLDQVRRDGYSTDLQDNELGICCVGAPVFDHTGRVVAGISLSTPTARFDRARLGETGQLMAAAAGRISAALGWAGPSAASGSMAG